MAELHSITGLFVEGFPGTSPWAGYFWKGEEDSSEYIEGQLVDLYGASTIIGTMDEQKLSFLKHYTIANGNQEFEYDFELKNGVWLGNYKSRRSDYNGRAVCKTHLIFDKMKFRRMDFSTQEGYLEAVFDDMEEKGLLKRVTNPNTGEELLVPISP